MKIWLLTTVLFITQVPAVIVPITHEAVMKTLARVTAKQALAAVCEEEKPLARHGNRTWCYSGTSCNKSTAAGGGHSGNMAHIYCFSGEETVVKGDPLPCSRSQSKLLQNRD